ncbi:MAG: hypothetical protein JSV63_03260 [Candidatus Aenigmatarchaeota archaeon]|nr:MAG: hypothetical protein JSV63_03260 [Candidatus Aenigmarchaeota archaeon]
MVGDIATFPNLVFPAGFEAGTQAMVLALAMNNTNISWEINYTITGYENEIPNGFWNQTGICTIGMPEESGGCMMMGGKGGP